MKLRSDVATSDPVATVGYRSGAEACIEMLRRRWLLVLVAGGGDCGRELAPIVTAPAAEPAIPTEPPAPRLCPHSAARARPARSAPGSSTSDTSMPNILCCRPQHPAERHETAYKRQIMPRSRHPNDGLICSYSTCCRQSLPNIRNNLPIRSVRVQCARSLFSGNRSGFVLWQHERRPVPANCGLERG